MLQSSLVMALRSVETKIIEWQEEMAPDKKNLDSV